MATHGAQSSYTANGVAFRRTFTDIPYCKAIYEIVKRLQDPSDAAKLALMKYTELFPFFEARYLLTDRMLRESWVRQVIEELIRSEKIAPRQQLHLVEGNVVERNDFVKQFDKATAHFRLERVAVICEGLLRYISLPDKEEMARNVYQVLHKFGGLWITPDIEVLSTVNATEESRKQYDEMAQRSGMDVRANLWEDIDHARSFYQDLGFSIEEHPILEILDDLVSPSRLNLSQEIVKSTLLGRALFVMRVNRSSTS